MCALIGARLGLGPGEEQTIEMVLRRRLDYLDLDPAGVRQFAHDMAQLHVLSRQRLRMLSFMSPVYERLKLSDGGNSLAQLLRHGEDRLVSTYLLGSDFFVNGADTARPVKYLGLLDARHACGNPFARAVV